jgi:hypothetical protein
MERWGYGCHLQSAASNMDQVAVERHARGPLLVCMLVHAPAGGQCTTLSSIGTSPDATSGDKMM